ncbi:beta strand repeat-containing protein [Methylocucumis oryzae]|nr:Ig-like domain-containing protein [Methylocucumis oryzae]
MMRLAFLAGVNQTVDEDAAAQNIIGWATAISDNDPEVVQDLAFVITNNSNSGLFSVAPSINATTGALSYTLAANAHGIATITAQLVDTGGTANGGFDTSPSQSFTITANPVNDAPLVTAPGPFAVTGNIAISIPAPGLLTTVSDPADGASAEPFTIKEASLTSTNNGNVTVNTSTGAFTYNPPPGFTGSDSFSYEVCDSGEPGSACTNATVDLNITGTIWFVDNTASSNGDGRLSSPFNSLSAFQTINDGNGNHPATGDNVFLYESSTAYIGPIILLDNQKLIGQDVTTDLVTAAGITLAPNSVAVPVMNSANGTVVRVTNTTASAVAVGLSNSANATIRGLTLGNVLASGTAIGSLGAGFGTLTITDTSINTNGRALNLTSGTLAATFDSITSSASNNNSMSLTSVGGSMTVTGTTSASNSSGNGIALNSTTGNWNFGTVNVSNTGGAGIVVSSGSAIIQMGATTVNTVSRVGIADMTGGSVTFSSLDINNTVNQGVIVLNNASAVTINGGSIQNAGATDFEISGGTGNVTYAGTITDDVGVLVSVNGATAGTKTFSGAITDNNDGDGSGISLTNNTGAAINFTGGLTLSTGANAAFSATGGGTINITGAGNRITTTTSTALNVTNTNIGASGLTFQSINAGTASGSSGVGIYLDNTGISGANAGLTVTGNGTSASGGTIQHKTGADGSTTAGIGIFLKDTKNASFSWMQLNDFDNGGIVGRNVQGFSLQNSVLNGVIGTNSAANGDGPIYFGLSNPSGTNGLQGTGLIRNTKISGGIENNLEFYNQSGSMSLTIEGSNAVSEGSNANSAADDSADCIIEENTTGSGNDGILMEMQGTAAATIVIDRCLFRDNKSQPVQLAAIDNASIVATIDESWVRKFDHGNEGFIGSNGTNGDLTAMINNNHVNNIDGTNIFCRANTRQCLNDCCVTCNHQR